jgi:2-dehydro-3-deoxy-D-arabinonate dehydratase
MTEKILVRFHHPDAGVGARVGLQIGQAVHDVTGHFPTVGTWLRTTVNRAAEAVAELEALARASKSYAVSDFAQAVSPGEPKPHLLAPVDTQEIWAAGVTYERSRAARQEEAIDGGDVYARVYSAARPELFFKALGWRVVDPYGEVGIRADATWNVPEPELAVVYNPALEAIGFTIGNDMSSRDIEGENPLYLPQAKFYMASCALGRGIVLRPTHEWPLTTIRLRIERGGATVFEDEISTERIRRKINELGDFLGRSNSFPDGVVLLTGTGIVPPSDFTLAAGDRVTIGIEGIGTLVNTVRVV